MLSILTDKDADGDRRAWAAEKAAPYLHAKPAPQPRTVKFDLPDTETPAGMVQAAGAILKAAAEGTLAPAEAQSLMAVLEMQRKVVVTVEILARLEALEGRSAG
jgi:hypothetical protein